MSAPKKLWGVGLARAGELVGIVAAVVVAVLVNVLVARHYKRWDVTKNQRFTLSSATIETLHDLPGPVQIWVLLGAGDPLEQSVKQLLASYQAETDKLDIHYVDPDRDRLEFEDVRKKFRIEAGRTEDSRIVADSVMVVAHGDRHWFLGVADMIEVSDAEDVRAKPREEQAITRAIRSVLRGEKSKLCFTAGHGELSLAEGGDQGLASLKEILEKDNYEVAAVDTSEPNALEPFKGCDVVVLAGMRAPLSAEEENRLRTYLLAGGNAFVAVSPINAVNEKGMEPPRLAAALAPFGIALDEDVVFETDPALVVPKSKGISFFAGARQHAVTAALVREEAHDAPRVVVKFARSLHHVAGNGASAAVDLLVTSAKAFGVVDITGAAEWTDAPQKKDADLGGPLVVAMASERPKIGPSAPHGPRLVVVGSASVLLEQNLRQPLATRGAAMLVENAISWLAAKPPIVDVPERSAVPAGMRITEESQGEIGRYVLLYLPLAVAFLGVAVALRRRGTEGAPRAKRVAKAKP